MDLFLLNLQNRLEQELPSNVVQEHTDYYRNYFREKRESGQSEEEILESLGDPLLIAKSILEKESAKSLHAAGYHNSHRNQGCRNTSFRRKRHCRYLPPGLLILFLIAALIGLGYLFFKLFQFLYPALLFCTGIFLICFALKGRR